MSKLIPRCPNCDTTISRIIEKQNKINESDIEKITPEKIKTTPRRGYGKTTYHCPRCEKEIAHNIIEVKKILGINIHYLDAKLKQPAKKRLKEIMSKYRKNKRSNLFNRVIKIKKDIIKTTNIPRWIPHKDRKSVV